MPRLSKYINGYEGKRYERWTVFCFAYSRQESRKGNAFYWICRCDCGEWRAVNIRTLERNGSKSCGCWRVEQTTQQWFKHGHNRVKNGHSPEYRSWDHAKQRTSNPNYYPGWHRYGGRGIVMCEGFQEFTNFLRIMGLKPSIKHSVDRINNDGNYSCGECRQCLEKSWPLNTRWATIQEQYENSSHFKRRAANGQFLPA